MFTPGLQNYINKVRIVGEVDDSLAFKLRLQSLLASTDFSIPGVSPCSVVCIRSLTDPRPGTLRLVRSELEGAGAWSEALSQSLVRKVNRAARPADGFVPSNAECVLFADRAEMLACLARDWLGGLLWARWWWKILLPAGDSSEIVKHLWRDSPQYVPAALDQLARERKGTAFVNALTEDDCRELLQQTVRSFAIQQLAPVCEHPLTLDRVNLSVVSTGTAFHADIESPVFELKLLTARWEQWCGEHLTRDVSPERQRFLGIMLTIVRAPAYARSREFARAVERWQEEIENVKQDLKTTVPPSTQVLHDRQSSSSAVIEAVETGVDPALAPSTLLNDAVDSEYEERQLAHDFESRRQADPPQARPSFSDSTTLLDGNSVRAVDLDESVELVTELRPEFVGDNPGTAAEPFIAARESAPTFSVEAVAEAARVEIETQLGGLFYLINLALYLNLYGDFTMPATPGIDLNIWDFVSLLGAELTGDEDAEDPIWEWLAEMSGREDGQSAAEDSERRDEKRVAPEWLSLLMPDVRTRLRTALASESDDDAARMLCRHYARVRATKTHVDVFFGLADLPLEIRFAGLDRDPGWVPAAGRFIAFHFD